jgi:dTDP-4-dehydrorhamnose 3,5-epimerase
VNIVQTPLPGVLVIEPKVFKDDRGHFVESFQTERYAKAGIVGPFVQDNWSRSKKGTLRGLHFQNPRPQGKLVMVTRGAVFDVAVDIRKSSPTFGRWFGAELNEENCKQMWVPPGYAHGFAVLSDVADFLYKCTDVYVPEADGCVLWNDPDLGIQWPVNEPLLSKKDAAAPRLRDSTKLPG